MSDIDIHAHHQMGHAQAQQAADLLARDLSKKFSIDYGWEGDTIHFERPGVNGQILLVNDEIRVTAHLGLFLLMLKDPIEQEIHRYLEDHFACTFQTSNG